MSQLRRVLLRRVARDSDSSDDVSVRQLIEQLLVRFQESRLLDDARYAHALAQSLRGRGQSEAKIRMKLRSRGISGPEADAALEALSGQELGEEQAALVYAKKRRFAERLDLSDPTQRQKALASLARQGFSFDVAKRALELAG